MPKKENGKTILQCSCGYKDTKSEKKLKEEIKGKKEEVKAVEKGMQTLPEVEATCTKCGNKKAYFWTMQTRGWDEPETQFYKCTKCEHSWRENA